MATDDQVLQWWRSSMAGFLPASAPPEVVDLARQMWQHFDRHIDTRLERAFGRVFWFLAGASFAWLF